VKAESKIVDDFLRAYVAAIQLIKKTVESYARLFKSPPFVPDRGIETVMKDLATRRSIPKEFIGRPDLFRDNGPLEKVLSRS
jgi:hypothetical protein